MKIHWKNFGALCVIALGLASCSILNAGLDSGRIDESEILESGSWVETHQFSYQTQPRFGREEPVWVEVDVISTLVFKDGRFSLEVLGPQIFEIHIANGGAFGSNVLHESGGNYTISADSLFLVYDQANSYPESFGYKLLGNHLTLSYQAGFGQTSDGADIISPGSQVWGFYNFQKYSGTFARAE